MLSDELEIKRLAKKYEFKRCDIFGDELFIESKCDCWVVRQRSGILELWHKNKYDRKTRLHKQRDYFDIPFLFKSISNHDKFKLKTRYNKTCRLTNLFNQIATNK